jgi:hypothetical protein
LAEDAELNDAAMRDSHVSPLDLDRGQCLDAAFALAQAVRQAGSEPDLSGVRLAYLERDGGVSVVLRHQRPRILEVAVDKDVQIIRIAVE